MLKIQNLNHHHEINSEAKTKSLLRVNSGPSIHLKWLQQQEQQWWQEQQQQQPLEQCRRDPQWRSGAWAERIYIGEEAWGIPSLWVCNWMLPSGVRELPGFQAWDWLPLWCKGAFQAWGEFQASRGLVIAPFSLLCDGMALCQGLSYLLFLFYVHASIGCHFFVSCCWS